MTKRDEHASREMGQVHIYGTFNPHASIAKLARVAEAEIEAFRMRPLKQAYFSVIIDAVFLSLRRGSYDKESVYIALGTDHEGRREILGFFLLGGEGESAHAWREIFGEIRKRGVERIDIVVSDDLPGIEEASRSVFPSCDLKPCFLHAVRNACAKVRQSDCSEVLSGLKAIYRAGDQKEAERALFDFEERWKKRYPSLVRYWRENFSHLTAFMKYPEQVRSYIYTTNQLERINKEIKRRCKAIEVFSSEESLVSVLYLILRSENDKLSSRRLRGFRNLGWVEEG